MRGLRRFGSGAAAILLILTLAFLAGGGGHGGDRLMGPEPVAVTAYPIPHFKRGDGGTKRFGPLEFVGGLELRGRHRNFGGISGFRVGGFAFAAVTDAGDSIGGQLIYNEAGALTGVSDVVIVPFSIEDGRRAKDVGLWDGESLAISAGTAYVGIERDHAILAFDVEDRGWREGGRRIPLPAFVRGWPENRGIEALGVMPAGSPYAGRLVGMSERSHGRDEPTEGFVMGADGSEPFRFRLARSDGFDVTDLDFLPSGDMIVLERYFSPWRGVAMRLRRAKTADIRPEATVDGEVLMTADGAAFHIDNMEGLSIHRNAAGDTIFTLVSDDNFSIAQRTLLLQFRWLGE